MGDLLVAIQEKGKTILSSLLPKLPPEFVSPTIKYKPLNSLPEEWRERDINRWLKEEFLSKNKVNEQNGCLRFIRYVSVELEEQNRVRLVVMTNAFIRLYIDAELSDLWHDHRTSSATLTIKSMTLLGVPLLPQFLSRWVTHLCMSIAGFLFNPIGLSKGALARLSADTICLDLHSYLQACGNSFIARYICDIDGKIKNDFIILGAETYRGGIKPKIHKLSVENQQKCRYRAERLRPQNKRVWFRLADIWQLALVAGVAFVMVLLVRPYIFPGIPTFSFSWSFFTSLLVFFMSMGLINLARWSYQFYWQSKRQSIVFRAEEIRYRIDRIARDIELEMDRFRQKTNDDQLESDLLRAGLHRLKVLMLQERIEKISREIKLKYVVAYVITIISEFVAFHYF
ncbi:MAG: hypothetical protein LLG02_04330 [Pelosinus sp.]|nr:hypothetical protein [Pelosinus sp.]